MGTCWSTDDDRKEIYKRPCLKMIKIVQIGRAYRPNQWFFARNILKQICENIP